MVVAALCGPLGGCASTPESMPADVDDDHPQDGGATASTADEPGSPDSTSGEGFDASTAAESSTTAPDGSFGELTHDEHIQPVWNRFCVGCHGPLNSTAGLDLSQDAYATLMERTHSRSGMPFITPGDPTQSYVFRKLSGTHQMDDLAQLGTGGPMPPNPPLEPFVLAGIEHWIATGAVQ
jgi:hypothetical protein